MGGRAQRAKTKVPPQSALNAADVMLDKVTWYVAKHINDDRPNENERIGTIEDWAAHKRNVARLERLLAQTQFIAAIMTGEVE